MTAPQTSTFRQSSSSGHGRWCPGLPAALLTAVLAVASAVPALADGGGASKITVAPADSARDAEVARQHALHEAQVLAARGRKLLAEGSYADARDALREALRLNPADAASRKLLQQAEAALGVSTAKGALELAREDHLSKGQIVRLQVQMELFNAETALKGKDFERAAQHADRALASLGCIEGDPSAPGLRKQAERLLADARAANERVASVRIQTELDKAKAQAAALKAQQGTGQAAGLRALHEQATKHLEAREYDEALAVAKEMLRTAPDDPDALALRDKALQPSLAPASLRGQSKERRDAETKLMTHIEKEFDVPKPGVILSRDPSRRETRARATPMERWEADLRAKLAKPVTMEFHETPLQQAVDQLAAIGGINILVDQDARPAAAAITMPRAQMPLESMVSWVAQLGGLRYCLRDGAVLLTGRKGTLDPPVTRFYDVGSLLVPPTGSQPIAVPGAIEPGPRATEAVEAAEPNPDLVGRGWADFIRSSIAADTWDQVLQEKQPYTIAYRNGRIVVVHTPEVQEQVGQLLDNFRKARNLQVHILARFITIDKKFLDNMSVSFQYNSGTRWTNDTLTGSQTPSADTDNAAMPRFDNWGPSGGLSLRWSYLNRDSYAFLLRAVLQGQHGTILQSPRLTCFNTQRANLQVVRNRNYVRRVSSDWVPEIGNIPSGIIFDIQPFVSGDRRYITLVFQPQLRNLLSMTDFIFGYQVVQVAEDLYLIVRARIQLPTTELKSIGTTVTIPNGGTLLLGGLTEVEEHSAVSTSPFIEGVPLLRYIFRGWDRREGRRSMIVLVTAQTVDDIFEEE